MVDGAALIERYFPNLSSDQKRQFAVLLPLYAEWNEKINVISRKDIDQLYERHVLHSLGIAKIAAFTEKDTVLDIGTGGGFPGIPLAIFFPAAQFLLVDSIAKKIKVVQEVQLGAGITNVRAWQSRAEDVKEPVTAVVCRAVTDITPFFGWISPKLKPGSKVYCLKGGDLRDELLVFKLKYPKVDIREHQLSDYFSEAFFETKKVVELTVN